MLAVQLYSLAKLSLRAWTDTVRACVVLAAATAVAQSVDHHLAYAVGAEQPHAVDHSLPRVVGGWLAVAARVLGFLENLQIDARMRKRLLGYVKKCVLAETQKQDRAEERYSAALTGSAFSVKGNHRAYAWICEARWRRLQKRSDCTEIAIRAASSWHTVQVTSDDRGESTSRHHAPVSVMANP